MNLIGTPNTSRELWMGSKLWWHRNSCTNVFWKKCILQDFDCLAAHLKLQSESIVARHILYDGIHIHVFVLLSENSLKRRTIAVTKPQNNNGTFVISVVFLIVLVSSVAFFLPWCQFSFRERLRNVTIHDRQTNHDTWQRYNQQQAKLQHRHETKQLEASWGKTIQK